MCLLQKKFQALNKGSAMTFFFVVIFFVVIFQPEWPLADRCEYVSIIHIILDSIN